MPEMKQTKKIQMRQLNMKITVFQVTLEKIVESVGRKKFVFFFVFFFNKFHMTSRFYLVFFLLS